MSAVSMDLLRNEIERKKKDYAQKKALVYGGTSMKFVRRGDLAKLEEEKQQKLVEELDKKRLEKKRKAEEEEESDSKLKCPFDFSKKKKKETNLNHAQEVTEENQQDLIALLVDDVKKRLRSMGHPVTLFGETNKERAERLKSLENENGAFGESHDFALSHGHEVKNTFLAKENNGTEFFNDDDDDDDDEEKDDHKESDNCPRFTFSNKKRPTDEYKLVLKFFRGLLKVWEYELNARPDELKHTAKGKTDTKTQKQCKDYIRPLFKLCKKREVPYDILMALVKMINYCEEGEFVKAYDEYNSVAIGNAPWPMGLTMVGIHERKAREKISSSNVAHVMNNEMQRKYLTSVKRLISFAQKLRPDVPPSKKVL